MYVFVYVFKCMLGWGNSLLITALYIYIELEIKDELTNKIRQLKQQVMYNHHYDYTVTNSNSTTSGTVKLILHVCLLLICFSCLRLEVASDGDNKHKEEVDFTTHIPCCLFSHTHALSISPSLHLSALKKKFDKAVARSEYFETEMNKAHNVSRTCFISSLSF